MKCIATSEVRKVFLCSFFGQSEVPSLDDIKQLAKTKKKYDIKQVYYA